MSRLASSPRLRAALFGLLPAILLAAGSPQARVAVAYVAPFLLLLVFLLADRYPGERLIRVRRSPAPRRQETASTLPRGFAEPRIRRGPVLALALAGRAPPSQRGDHALFRI